MTGEMTQAARIKDAPSLTNQLERAFSEVNKRFDVLRCQTNNLKDLLQAVLAPEMPEPTGTAKDRPGNPEASEASVLDRAFEDTVGRFDCEIFRLESIIARIRL